MLLELLLFLTLATATSTVAALAAVRARFWVSLPIGFAALMAAGWGASLLTGDPTLLPLFPTATLVAVLVSRLLVPRWGYLAVQMLVTLAGAALVYLVYAAVISVEDPLGPIAWIGSALLLVLEAAALALSFSYTVELLGVLGRRDRPYRRADAEHLPPAVIQVPAYNEPTEVMRETLAALAEVDYPDLLVQVVDNNTPDPKVWRLLKALCQELGPRFQFIHLEDWPGYKAGALNEATRRLPRKYELIAVVDADYVVEPDFLKKMAPFFSDPKVAFVQSSQNYRDWKDDAYLRGLFYSYRYFFDVSMPARAQSNAIIFAGTMGIVRRSALEEIGGWNADCVTEDAEASLRLLGRGYQGIYDQVPHGAGLMPLTFSGLKGQRFRWALGGMQILRAHWRELLPGFRHRLRLSLTQRITYLLGSLQWFGDLLNTAFFALLVLTAAAIAFHHRLPVRQLVGAAIAIPVMFLFTGLLRALWALRAATGCRWGDAWRALLVWFSLGWVVGLACLRGLIKREAAFLRTPKRREGEAGFWVALRSAAPETTLAAVGLAAALVMLWRAPSIASLGLALLLGYQTAYYGSALWASAAAEGIELTPFRRAYRGSAQSTGERPGGQVPTLVWAAVAVVLLLLPALLLPEARPGPVQQPELPPVGKVLGQSTPPSPSPSASPAPSVSVQPSVPPPASPSPNRR